MQDLCYIILHITFMAHGVLGYFNTLSKYSVCKLMECCNEDYIKADIHGLDNYFAKNLFGQHIVRDELISALEAHYKSNKKSRKPLVLSFHGTPGTGKTMAANAIVKAVYELGENSRFVKIYNGKASFPVGSKVDEYNEQINQDVSDTLNRCPQSMFIFNEVNKMPAGIFESLSSWVDYTIQSRDNSQAVFIFISNTAGVEIADHLGNLMKNGVLRNDTRLHDFEDIIRRAAFNLDGGLKKTSLIKAHVIDHFVPFLPLEISHVVQCLRQEFRNWDTEDNENINEIIAKSVTFDSTHGLFSSYGCKGLDKDVAIVVKSKSRRKTEF